MGEMPGLAWPVVERLHGLQKILESLETGLGERNGKAKNGRKPIDADSFMQTACAITRAYKMGQLDWNPGFVTYWCAGKQLCLPRPFRWDEYRVIHDLNNGHASFWVEGVSPTE
jgi:hypothetical protein